MLNAAAIRTNISGLESAYPSCAVVGERLETGAVLLKITPASHHCRQVEEAGAENKRPYVITLPCERLVSLTADMTRNRWYLHVGMASGRVDITAGSRKEQTQWFILLRPMATPDSGMLIW